MSAHVETLEAIPGDPLPAGWYWQAVNEDGTTATHPIGPHSTLAIAAGEKYIAERESE